MFTESTCMWLWDQICQYIRILSHLRVQGLFIRTPDLGPDVHQRALLLNEHLLYWVKGDKDALMNWIFVLFLVQC